MGYGRALARHKGWVRENEQVSSDCLHVCVVKCSLLLILSILSWLLIRWSPCVAKSRDFFVCRAFCTEKYLLDPVDTKIKKTAF